MQAFLKEKQYSLVTTCEMIQDENPQILSYIFLKTEEMPPLSLVTRDFEADLEENLWLQMLIEQLYKGLSSDNNKFEGMQWKGSLMKEFQDESIAMLREMVSNIIKEEEMKSQ